MGVASSTIPNSGEVEEQGTIQANNTTHKPIGAPTLRRDPTAHENLKIINIWTEACREDMVEYIKDLSNRTKRQLTQD